MVCGDGREWRCDGCTDGLYECDGGVGVCWLVVRGNVRLY
jgi:hypothetical protein